MDKKKKLLGEDSANQDRGEYKIRVVWRYYFNKKIELFLIIVYYTFLIITHVN